MKIAIIDLGSNSARMTIWNCADGKKEVLFNSRIYVRLSEGLSKDNLLKKEPMDRAIAALVTFAKELELQKCDHVIAVATEAVRRASNKDEFIKKAYDETGILIKVLSGDDEAKYDFLAAKNLIHSSSAFLLDVGGGSLELIRVDNGELKDHTCLPFGAVVVSDRFGNDSKKLEEFFNETFSSLPLLENPNGHFIIGLGGSVRSLFASSIGVNDGNHLEKDEFLKVYKSIITSDIEDLKKEPAFNDRYDIINAGIAPFKSLFTLTDAEKIVICNKGVREGILRECMTTNSKKK